MTEPSNAELAARIADIKADFRAGFDRVEQRFGKAVSTEMYQLQIAELTNKIIVLTTALADERRERVEAIRAEAREREEAEVKAQQKRTALYRWVIGGIVVPVGLVVLQFYATFRGLG